MKCFIDYTQNVSRQTFSAAVIVDTKGRQQGKIVIRFTDSSIGYNHHVGVVFYPAEMSFSDSKRKGGTYSQPGTLFKVFDAANVACFTWHKDQLTGYDSKNKNKVNTLMADCLSQFNEITWLKYKRKEYRILWAM